jgi:hypothetical protein
MRPPEIISKQATLDARCEEWRKAGSFAFDTEFIRDDTYDATLCLIQVTTDGTAALIDPTADVDVRVFWQLVADPAVMTIVHAGKEDFEVCLRTTGQVPRNVFDVQVAAGFVGRGYPLSLVRLVESVLKRRISKGQTLTTGCAGADTRPDSLRGRGCHLPAAIQAQSPARSNGGAHHLAGGGDAGLRASGILPGTGRGPGLAPQGEQEAGRLGARRAGTARRVAGPVGTVAQSPVAGADAR